MNAGAFDAVVVGSGAGGAAAAWRLSTQGAKVLVLEAGPRFDPYRDYRLDQPDWELSRFPEHPVRHPGRYSFAPLQPLDPALDELRSWNAVRGRLNLGARRWGYGYHHVRGVGGSTLHFTGEAHRLHPAAMQMKTRFGVAADWPFDYAELEPWYEIAERVLGVAGPVAGQRPRRSAFPLPAHDVGYASRLLLAADTGCQWEANSLAVLSQPYDGRPACNHCANCNRGCPRRDKGSADVTFMRQAEGSGRCRVLTDAPVLQVEAGADGRVRRVVYVQGGRQHAVETRVLVLACGAVQTPALLLNSAGPHAADGLANDSGQLGRHFMETLSWHSSGLHALDLGSHRGLPADLISWSYNAPDAIPGVAGGCRFSTATAEIGFGGPVAYARRAVPGWGKAHKRAMRAAMGHLLTVGAIGESLPNPGSYIDLDPVQRDEFRRPLARIHSHLPASEIERLRFMARRCRRILDAVGISDRCDEFGSYDFFSATHVFGGCRMGTRAADSVVNADGRAWAWRNLFIADASVFPSSGGGESPSLTIEALAIRCADRIVQRLARQEL